MALYDVKLEDCPRACRLMAAQAEKDVKILHAEFWRQFAEEYEMIIKRKETGEALEAIGHAHQNLYVRMLATLGWSRDLGREMGRALAREDGNAPGR